MLVAILEADAGVFSVPSKVLSYLCAGRPLLLAVPKENLAAKIVVECGAGLVVEPSDLAGFCAAARQVGGIAASCVSNWRRRPAVCRGQFRHRRITDRFEAILQANNGSKSTCNARYSSARCWQNFSATGQDSHFGGEFLHGWAGSGPFRTAACSREFAALGRAAGTFRPRVCGGRRAIPSVIGAKAMIKKALMGVVGLGLATVFLFGRDASSYISTTYHRFTNRVTENVPVEFQIDRARQMVQASTRRSATRCM